MTNGKGEERQVRNEKEKVYLKVIEREVEKVE